MLSIQRILVPTDFSEHAEKALDTAIEFARSFGAEICLVHCYEINPGAVLPEWLRDGTALEVDESVLQTIVGLPEADHQQVVCAVLDPVTGVTTPGPTLTLDGQIWDIAGSDDDDAFAVLWAANGVSQLSWYELGEGCAMMPRGSGEVAPSTDLRIRSARR